MQDGKYTLNLINFLDIDQLVQANPHALHSLDPQAGVDI